MKLILAFAFVAFAQSAYAISDNSSNDGMDADKAAKVSKGYTYTYTNTITTLHEPLNYDPDSGWYFGGPGTEEREHTISFSTLLADKIRPNTTYDYLDVIANSYKGINDNQNQGFLIAAYPFTSITFKTDDKAMITDWNLSGGNTRGGIDSNPGHDRAVEYRPWSYYELGETSTVGTWVEQHVNYIKNNDDRYGPDYSYTVTPIGNVVSPVPEPETYAMFMAGLGLIGFVKRRKDKHLAKG